MNSTVSKGWIQAVVLVVLFGFFVLGLLAYRTYMAQPPVPARVVDENGSLLFTGSDISEGQQVFLHNGLMEYGSVFGHGAYLGPDYTADYLRRSSDFVRESYGASSDAAVRRTVEDMRTNRYSEGTDTLTFSAPRIPDAFRELVPYYSGFFSEPTTKHGLRPDAITGSDPAAAADGVLRLDGVGGGRGPAGPTTTRTPTTGRRSRASPIPRRRT